MAAHSFSRVTETTEDNEYLIFDLEDIVSVVIAPFWVLDDDDVLAGVTRLTHAVSGPVPLSGQGEALAKYVVLDRLTKLICRRVNRVFDAIARSQGIEQPRWRVECVPEFKVTRTVLTAVGYDSDGLDVQSPLAHGYIDYVFVMSGDVLDGDIYPFAIEAQSHATIKNENNFAAQARAESAALFHAGLLRNDRTETQNNALKRTASTVTAVSDGLQSVFFRADTHPNSADFPAHCDVPLQTRKMEIRIEGPANVSLGSMMSAAEEIFVVAVDHLLTTASNLDFELY